MEPSVRLLCYRTVKSGDPAVGELLEPIAPVVARPIGRDDRALADPRVDDPSKRDAHPIEHGLDDRGARGEEPDPGLAHGAGRREHLCRRRGDDLADLVEGGAIEMV